MCLLRSIIKLLCLLSLSLAQGPFNGYGIGALQNWTSPSEAGASSIGLVPSYRSGIALSNPTTWHNLRFTFLSISYNGFESSLENSSKNGYSNLQSAQFIIPIKQKHALGIELHPYSYQKIDLVDSLEQDFNAFNDTISIEKQFNQAGGVMAFDLSASTVLLNKTNLGLTFQFLFGSSRQNNSLLIDEIPYTISSRLNYSGVNTLLYANTNIKNFNIFFKTSFSLKPLDAIETKLYPYFDTNKNGYHDFVYDYLNPGYDFPHPNDVPEPETGRLTNIHDHSSVGIGISKTFLKRLQLAIELENNSDNSDFNSQIPNSFNSRIVNSDYLSMGMIWFPNEKSFRFIDNFTFRSGLSFNNFLIDDLSSSDNDRIKSNNNISEFGYSIGLGYKFKSVGNQIDFTYHSSLRSHGNDSYGEELFRGFQVGISIADIWFIKRRQR